MRNRGVKEASCLFVSAALMSALESGHPTVEELAAF
jgi:hypothetical protein